jgi:hypothetical protein
MVISLHSTSTSVFWSDFVNSGSVEFEIRYMVRRDTLIVIVCEVNKEILPVSAFCWTLQYVELEEIRGVTSLDILKFVFYLSVWTLMTLCNRDLVNSTPTLYLWITSHSYIKCGKSLLGFRAVYYVEWTPNAVPSICNTYPS